MASADKIPGGAEERHRVYARMFRKIFVLESDGGVDKRGRNLPERSPDAIFLVAGQRDAKNVAIAIAHPRGEIDPVEQGRLWQCQPNGSEHHRDKHKMA